MNVSPSLILGPLANAAFLWRGLQMLFLPGLRRYVWVPLLVNLVLYTGGFWLAAHYFSAAMNGLLPGWLSWLHWLLWPLFAALLSLIAFFTFTLAANLVGAPFYGFLAEKVLALENMRLPGAAPSGRSLSETVLASLVSECKRLAYFAKWLLPLAVLSVIPGINFIAPFLWALFGAWSLALEYRAYALDTQNLPFSEQIDLARASRLDVLAFGGWVMLGLGIPGLNILIPPAAVIGATLCLGERERARRAG
jgi:CysZ protein